MPDSGIIDMIHNPYVQILLACIVEFFLWRHQRQRGLQSPEAQRATPPAAPFQAVPEFIEYPEQPEPEIRFLRGNRPLDWELVLARWPNGSWVILDVGESLATSLHAQTASNVDDADTEQDLVRDHRLVGIKTTDTVAFGKEKRE